MMISKVKLNCHADDNLKKKKGFEIQFEGKGTEI
jgi:hypothetical protein